MIGRVAFISTANRIYSADELYFDWIEDPHNINLLLIFNDKALLSQDVIFDKFSFVEKCKHCNSPPPFSSKRKKLLKQIRFC